MSKNKEQTTLTDNGKERRRKMLSELKSELHRSTERRSKRNVLLAVGVSALLVGGIVLSFNWKFKPANHVVDNELSQPKTSSIEETGSNAESPPPKAPPYRRLTFETISDEELLAAMAELGHPSVLGEIGGQTTLVLQGDP